MFFNFWHPTVIQTILHDHIITVTSAMYNVYKGNLYKTEINIYKRAKTWYNNDMKIEMEEGWINMIFENMRVENINAVVRYTPPANKKLRSPARTSHFLGIMLDGSAHHDFGYKSFTSTKNCIFFYNQRDVYDFAVIEPGASIAVYFSTAEEIETESFCIPVTNPNEFINLLTKLKHLKESSNTTNHLLLSTFYQLCHMFSELFKQEYFHKDTRIEKAKCYIDLNFKNHNCLHTAVAESGLSSRRFNDLFKSNFKTTPNQYIIQRKIEHAKCLLETTNISVVEIAKLSGFSDVYYFSKTFKKICGVAPSKWSV